MDISVPTIVHNSLHEISNCNGVRLIKENYFREYNSIWRTPNRTDKRRYLNVTDRCGSDYDAEHYLVIVKFKEKRNSI
jgi:hypothetical protein